MYAGGLEQMTFKGFGGLLWAARVFMKFDTSKDGLDPDEWNAILDSPKFNPPLLELIDNLIMPT